MKNSKAVHRHYRYPRVGITFVEIIVISVILTVLIALLMPAIGKARAAARNTYCKNNLKNIALGITLFHDTYKRLPASGNYGHREDGSGYRLHSWAVSILPYIDRNNLYESLDLSLPLTHKDNVAIRRASVPLYACPLDITRNEERIGDLSYAVNGGVGFTHFYKREVRDCPIGPHGAFAALDLNGDGNACSGERDLDDLDREIFRSMGLFFLETWNTEITKRHYSLGEVRDGTSNTFMVGENVRTGFRGWDDYGHFGDPTPQYSAFYIGPPCRQASCVEKNINYGMCNSGRYGINSGLWASEGGSPVPNSFHAGGVNMAFSDGHVRFLSEKIDGAVYAALASPQGDSLDDSFLRQAIPSGF